MDNIDMFLLRHRYQLSSKCLLRGLIKTFHMTIPKLMKIDFYPKINPLYVKYCKLALSEKRLPGL